MSSPLTVVESLASAEDPAPNKKTICVPQFPSLEHILKTQGFDAATRQTFTSQVVAILHASSATGPSKQNSATPPLFLALYGLHRTGKMTILSSIRDAVGFVGGRPFYQICPSARNVSQGRLPEAQMLTYVSPTNWEHSVTPADPERQQYIARFQVAWYNHVLHPCFVPFDEVSFKLLRDGERRASMLSLATLERIDVTLPPIVLIAGDETGHVYAMHRDSRKSVEMDPARGVYVFDKMVPHVIGNTILDEQLTEEFVQYLQASSQ
jgi:hypothetical protein